MLEVVLDSLLFLLPLLSMKFHKSVQDSLRSTRRCFATQAHSKLSNH